MHPWLVDRLRCPADKSELTQIDGGIKLRCAHGHEFAVVKDIPVMLLAEWEPTDPQFHESLRHVAEGTDPLASAPPPTNGDQVDPVVQSFVAGSCGNMYVNSLQRLTRYPIPRLRLPAGNGKWLLDIGCAWGRWSHSAARLGYKPIGIDPSLRNVLAATRIAKQLGHDAAFVVADGRYLPFANQSFDAAFSYSVLQHLSKENVRTVLPEIRRVLKPGGTSLIEMANKFGVRSRMVEWKRGEAKNTEVRYWRPRELLEAFNQDIGPTRWEVDGFFCLNPQMSDLDLLPIQFKGLVITSEILRGLSHVIPGLRKMADSVYMRSSPR